MFDATGRENSSVGADAVRLGRFPVSRRNCDVYAPGAVRRRSKPDTGRIARESARQLAGIPYQPVTPGAACECGSTAAQPDAARPDSCDAPSDDLLM